MNISSGDWKKYYEYSKWRRKSAFGRKRVRQGCPIGSLLFAAYVRDIEEMFE